MKNRMWGQLGWFSGLVCVGSLLGAVSWGANMQSFTFLYEPYATRQQYYSLLASTFQWYAAFNILYGLEFLCFIVPKLMMLGRLTSNATRSLQAHEQEQGEGRGERVSVGVVARVYRVIAAAVVLCSVGVMLALDVSGGYRLQFAVLSDQAAATCDAQGNDTNFSITLNKEAAAFFTKAGTASSVQCIFEAIALLLISTAYLILVPLSVAMFRRAERLGAHALATYSARADAGDARSERTAAIMDDTMKAAADQRRRLVTACVVVLATFPVRAAFDLFYAYTVFDDPYNPACGFCGPCQTDRFLARWWLIYTPEFQPIVVALSSPLPLFVSLWIITGAHAQAYAISLNILRARLGRDVTSPPSAVEKQAPVRA